MSSQKILLAASLPRAGFRWRRGQGPPRVLRSVSRDEVVQQALVNLLGRDRVTIRKEDARRLVAGAVAAAARAIDTATYGIRPDEGIIDFLLRVAPMSKLSRVLPGDVW